jgi:hypothetical protein
MLQARAQVSFQSTVSWMIVTAAGQVVWQVLLADDSFLKVMRIAIPLPKSE